MEEEEPNLGKLVDQKVEQIYWDRTLTKKVKEISIIFERNILHIDTDKDYLKVRLVER